MKGKNHVFRRDVLLLWNIFAVLNLMLTDLTVRWLIEKTTLLEEKNLFSLLRVIFLGVLLVAGILPLPYPKPKSSPYSTYSAKGKEHRTLTHPLCYEVLET